MIKLQDYPTKISDWKKKHSKEELKLALKKIGALQYQMYAQQKYSLLILFQGLDAAGKDGLVTKLFKYTGPVSVVVKSFKKPTHEEYAHDFLWRVHQHTPKKGNTQVFIRSHYEDILVPSVEGFIQPEVIEKRYEMINDFERLVQHNDTRILKFFLHVSKEEQEARLNERLEVERKFWKHNDGDWETRKKFDAYMEVYEKVVNRCSDIPWHIIPADSNIQKLTLVADEVLKTLENMQLAWPPLETEMKRD